MTMDPATPIAAEVEPLPDDGVQATVVGIGLWLIGLVTLLALHSRLAARGESWWIWVMGAGAAFGLPGLWFALRRRAAYRAVGPTS
jgi:cellobiose-specific phosphotransferase system component IIC